MCLCLKLGYVRRDRNAFVDAVTGPFSAKRRKELEKGWPLHRGFGACADDSVWHTRGVWAVRQDTDLYEIGRTLLGRDDLHVTLDRGIQKLPGQGESEFLHLDYNPFKTSDETQGGNEKVLQGKIVYTESNFICVPGTHTDAFLKEFQTTYAPIYPRVSEKDKKFELKEEKEDPMNLIGRKREIRVPAGCVIFWNDRLFHGVNLNPKDAEVKYGMYVGFKPAVSREGYKTATGRDELQDRLRSFKEGCAPLAYPSMDMVWHCPKMFQSFPKGMKAYLDKLPPDSPLRGTRMTKKGDIVETIKSFPNTNYKAPKLTALGEQGLRAHAVAPADGR